MDKMQYRRRVLYDEAADVYRAAYMWEYDPKTGKWTEGSGRVEGWDSNSESWWYYSAWAWDPDGKRYLGFGSGRGAMFYPAQKKAIRVAGGGPSRTYNSAMAYDRRTRHFVLFGAGSEYDETWLFSAQNNSWRRTHPDESPPGRSGHNMIAPDGAKAVVLFGGMGRRRSGGSSTMRFLNDTWAYEPAADRWTKLAPETAPPACYGGMVLDRARDLGVLFNSRGEAWTLKATR
jgi:N-acetylneuraminic acid mutarotase